jgi:hypothetical protein
MPLGGRLFFIGVLAALAVSAAPGCGTTKSRLATEQLLMSDAVDRAVAGIDFQSLAGKKVYFDSRYVVNVKGAGFVNSEYVISSLRQQMVAADLRLQDKPEDAEYVVEARVGTLGTDGNEIVYGIPANRGISEAANLIPNVPQLPAIPELSLARKESQVGAFKVAAFAYNRRSGEPVWQSGIARTTTTSQDVWVFGAGPFQQGSIHDHTTFAGNDIRLLGRRPRKEELAGGVSVPLSEEFYFRKSLGGGKDQPGGVRTVQHTEPAAAAASPAKEEKGDPPTSSAVASAATASTPSAPAAPGTPAPVAPAPDAKPVPLPEGAAPPSGKTD